MVIPVEVVNGTIQLTDSKTVELVNATWNLVYATIAGIVVSAGLTIYITFRSNNLLRQELIAKFQPRFDFTNPNLVHHPPDGNTATFSCQITNKGSAPINNIVIHRIGRSSELTPEILLREERTIKQAGVELAGTLEIDRFHWLSFTFATDPREDTYVAIWLSYEYFDWVKEEGLAIFRFFSPSPTDMFATLPSNGFAWFSSKDIKQERKRLGIR